ncbi:hypothetical protein [Amphritea japonica]|uniref:Lipoprotein n=1 Tax=Amphritea japonica ATCC BAA-1530 TaxID=1278309 RepID=A0A7R6SUF5_9GAMM|nr:hypothetical protein [Amphritea japonica]BBB27660.1 conserved hypothetical protein [Amphritea japonica ATCC BAA-1530]
MRLFLKPVMATLLVTGLISGCASNSNELKAAHVSTAGFKGLSCTELHAELQSSINVVNELTTVIDDKADDDKAQMAIGMILFWPALFALEGGDGIEAAEYSRMKGEINAMEEVAILNQCQSAIDVAQQYRAEEQKFRLAAKKPQASQQNNNTAY